MNINSNDKKSIKNFITVFFSIQSMIGIAILFMFIFFGMKFIKTTNNFQNHLAERFKDRTMEKVEELMIVANKDENV